jgi:molecular chaperone DnaK
MGHVIGIDLGTTNCCVAVVEHGSPAVISNRVGYPTTPSVVAITETGKQVVGQIAARQAITNPEHTVSAAKRLIGRSFDSPQAQHAREHAAYQIVEGPHGDIRIELRGRRYSIPELSAALLQEMRVIAEEHLGEPVDKAVVTVPAYFNDGQRQAVREAGRIAGLDVLRIVNEPTAAALAYGFKLNEPKRIAVYDLGGGTFDISIVEVEADGDFTVTATTGDSYLGGEDFDQRLVEWLARGFTADHGIDLLTRPIALQRLRLAAQKAKCELSTLESVDVQLPFIVQDGPEGPINLDYCVEREQLEKLTGDLVTRTLRICEEAVRLAGIRPRDIDEVILVGGMTRMPAVQWAVREYFDREPSRSVHPDEVVALGAAIQGAALAEVPSIDISLQDVTAHSLGIMTVGGGFEVMIPFNSPVPAQQNAEFTTSHDGQDTVTIVVLQGESERAEDNEILGHFALSGLRPAPAGTLDIEVSFNLNEDGIFHVSARDVETGEEALIEVSASGGLEEEEIEAMSTASAEFLAERRAEERAERLRQQVESLVAEVERLVERVPPSAAEVNEARDLVAQGSSCLKFGGLVELEEAVGTLAGVRGKLRGLAEDYF